MAEVHIIMTCFCHKYLYDMDGMLSYTQMKSKDLKENNTRILCLYIL